MSDDELVFGFDRPHRPGTVCGCYCEQCGRGLSTGANGEPLPETAFLILEEATRADWERSVRQNGGDPFGQEDARYYYFVRPD